MASAELDEQQEKLRRVVDNWRCRSHDLLKTLHKDPFQISPVFGTFSLNSAPVRVHAQPLEHSDILTLIGTDNVLVSKFVTVLSYDCIEISRLTQYARRNIYRQMFLFGHGSSSQEILLEGEPQKAFGQSLSLFMELSKTTSRMSEVMCNLLQQLDSIYSLKDKNDILCKSFKKVILTSAFSSFADGLAMFLVLDEILAQNGRIKSYLSLYARMLNKVKLDPNDFDIAFGDLDCLDQVIIRLEKLLDAGFFRRLLLEELSWVDTLQKVRQNRKLLDACSSFIHDGLQEILSRLDTWKESLLDRRKILHHVALFLFGTYASGEMPEKRLGKVIGEMLKLVPVIYSEGGLRLMLLDLLRNQFPPSMCLWPTFKDAVRDCDAMKKNYLAHLNEMHSRDWQKMKDALAYWVVSFQSTIHPVEDLSRVEACLQLHFKQIIQGILVASRMQMMAISMLDLHTLLEVPIRRERLKSLCHMVVLMKVMKKTFHDKELDIIKSLPHIINLIQSDIENTLLMAKDELLSEVAKESQASKRRFLSSLPFGGKDVDSRLTDSLSAILISLQMLRGGGSSNRQLILSIVLDVLQSIGHLDVNCSRIKKLLYKLEIVADFQSMVEEVTNCDFLYWRKEMMTSWFSMVYMDANKFSWLQYLLDAFSDGLWLLKVCCVGKFTIHSHEEELENAVKNEIITPLCRDIETDLRLHVHSNHLKGSVHVNPRKTGVRNLSWYLHMEPLWLPFKCINIKLHVESYLNSTFYNHTAMSSYDWKIYSEMRQLAELKYGLTLDDIPLTGHCLNYGVDVMEIVRNVEQFATSYSYNMTNQVLIEKVSSCQGRKALRVVGVEHVALSIATHGLGTIYTAIDSVLKLLTEKIIDLSKLLQDNFACVCSVKEIQFWKGNEGETRGNPFLRGEKHDLFTGKLFFGVQELNFLDKLRGIINEMGNILGLLRILRAGGSRHLCSISRFIYRDRNIRSFKENSQKLGFTDETITAGRILDVVVEDKCQAKEHVYFSSSFTSIISKEVKGGEDLKFEDLFLIIPALIIGLIDSRVNSKENMLRRGREVGNQIIIDDGFVMGTAFILKVTAQEKPFDGLDWITSVKKRLEEALRSLEERIDAEQRKANRGLSALKLWGKDASSVSSTETQKVIDKLKKYQKEVELFYYGLNISRTIMS
ncbi:WASH complex subunit 4-like isoform X2 [Telopea speciosissima]|uniref:WASH complex subunit 4-like isoform X1 n=1 Tax=Telopea speciosissima TaxID=54955 RepID=UPI001CC44D8C|nr:WASH complex subunit 4-like isoform X1 [Telopea speciosissima]XP_043716644.1 WASH complex subunit 4-like isoform X2 [Telopea speciosissima]